MLVCVLVYFLCVFEKAVTKWATEHFLLVCIKIASANKIFNEKHWMAYARMRIHSHWISTVMFTNGGAWCARQTKSFMHTRHCFHCSIHIVIPLFILRLPHHHRDSHHHHHHHHACLRCHLRAIILCLHIHTSFMMRFARLFIRENGINVELTFC